MKKRRMKRFLSGSLAVLIMVSLNINPLAMMAAGIVDSGIVDRFINLKNNLVYVAQNGFGEVEAAESETPTLPDTPGGTAANSCDCSFECDATEAIDTLMGSGDVTLTDIKNAITTASDTAHADAVLIKGTIEDGNDKIVAQLGDINTSLKTISDQLVGVENSIRLMQHQYRVAHVYSLNNEANNSLWRPYSKDVPYVEDFAIVSGPFASVYMGYWDTAVTTLTNPMGSNAERALNILGYDAIVRYEGVVLQRSVNATGNAGLSGQSTTYSELETPGSSAWTIATVEREEIGTDAVTWLDAVTLLYKALGQEQYTYQSFKSRNYAITPETSPAFSGLSNPVPTVEADGTSHYEGWDFKIFLSRSNVISGVAGQSSKTPIYWTKALSDGFIPVGKDLNDEILASDFLKLAHRMMVAYGEPEMSMDETMALLQVYGTNFPISLGIDTADAWAYLKVRGCLGDDVIQHIGSVVSREDLLDICMRIKDKESRFDYKNIEVVLDIGELLRDDGYYPVYDLEFSTGQFSTTIEYDYSKMESYGYCVTMTQDMLLGNTGKMVICSEPDINKRIDGAQDVSSSFDIEGNRSILFTVPNGYTGNIYVTMVDLGKQSIVPGSVEWISIPSSLLGGGYFFGNFTMSNDRKIATAREQSYHELDYLSGDKRLHPYADFVRAGSSRPTPTVASADATVLEVFEVAWNKWTTPMVVEARLQMPEGVSRQVSFVCYDESSGSSSGSSSKGSSASEKGYFRYVDTLKFIDGDLVLDSWPEGSENMLGKDAGGSLLVRTPDDAGDGGLYIASDARTLYLSRMYLAANYEVFLSSLAATSSPKYDWTGYMAEHDSKSVTVNECLDCIFTGAYESGGLYSGFTEGAAKVRANAESNTKVTSDSNGSIYVPTYGELAARYMLGAAPGVDMANYGSSTSVRLCDALNTMTISTDRDVTSALNAFRSRLTANEVSKTVNQNVENAVKASKLSGASYNADTDEFSFTFDSEEGAQSFIDTVGTFQPKDTMELDIQSTVATSAIMSRDEEKLLSWTSLVEAGVVIPEKTGGRPTQQSDGSYMFYTKDGMVKVNPLLSTIQIGTTIYDLAPTDGSKGPLLVYVDTTHQEAQEMYIDVRCVMGLVAQDFVRNGEKTTQLRNVMGSQGYVVYDIGAKGLSSPIFTSYDVQCYNFPDVPKGIISWVKDSNIMSGYYPVKIFGSTKYDDQYEISSGVNYWPDENNYSRLGMSSFVPTANWITVINQEEDEEIDASLFVYYPMEPFEHGFQNQHGDTALSMPTDFGIDFSSEAAQVESRTALKAALDSCYPEEKRDLWYVQMTYAAAKDLYDMTGLWYLRGDFVIREFKIKENAYNSVDAWAEYSGTTVKSTVGGVERVTYKDAGNAVGAIYWLDGIGFVYNMPTVDEFTLQKYFDGEYPLPIATFSNGTGGSAVGRIGIMNYNMNYWGAWVDKDGKDRAVVPYGYTLSPDGYVHYTAMGSDVPKLVSDGVTVSCSMLPTRDDPNSTKNGVQLLPYKTAASDVTVGSDYLHLAPSGVYFYFGGNTLENVPPNATTKTMSMHNQFYYGTSRVVLQALEDNGYTAFDMVSTIYNPIRLENTTSFYRVYRNESYDILINNSKVVMGSTSGLQDVIIDDYITDYVDNPLDNLGATNLISMIDEGSSFLIVFAFNVLPMIGIILMTILVGLSFVSNIKIVQVICDKTIDPIKILTFGSRDIYHWSYKTVLIPCILLYCVFALFLNGNIIRLISWVAEWYGVISRYAKNMF